MSTCLLHSFFLGSKYLTLSGASFRQGYLSWHYPSLFFAVGTWDMKHLKIEIHFWTWIQRYREREEQEIVNFETSIPFFNLWLPILHKVKSVNIHQDKITSTGLLEAKSGVKCRNFSPQNHDSPFNHEASVNLSALHFPTLFSESFTESMNLFLPDYRRNI